MWRYLVLTAIILYSSSPSIYAANATCSGSTQATTLDLPPVNVVLGSNIPDYTMLYAIRKSMTNVGNNALCSRAIRLAMTLDGVTSASKLPNEPTYDTYTHKIYPTDIPGLGISVITDELRATNRLPVPAWPDTQLTVTDKAHTDVRGFGNWFSLYLWKIPGDLPPGTLAFTGPTVEFLITPNNTADTVSTSGSMQSKNAKNLIWARMATKGSVNLINGTCNILGGSKIVQMGTWDGSGSDKSAWVDSSFKLNCPNASGYGGGKSLNESMSHVSETLNYLQNGPIRLQIRPYTGIAPVPAPDGTIELDGSGATGYGIQLAWGDVAVLGDVPANPVMFNSWIAASLLNAAAYRSTTYPIGAAAITGDGTLKMAARYVRIPGRAVSGGPANASIEVIASYQ